MQLKLTRAQRDGGLVSRSVIFCLDARAELTHEEQANVHRYKLGGQVIYNSEASKRHLDRANAQNDGSMIGGLKSLASVALAAMKLNITVNSLQNGQHIECKTLDELLGAEDALMIACRNLKGYLDTAATFDGREALYDFSSGEPVLIAPRIPIPVLAVSAPLAEPSPQLAALALSESPASSGDEAHGAYATAPKNLSASSNAETINPHTGFDFASIGERVSNWWRFATTGQRVMASAGAVFTLYILYEIL
ncbi:MAG: hypothetical protein WDM89_22095 [Rhizomicrobium sp.]